jgi:hypothetical protein
MNTDEKARKIARLNDLFRRSLVGGKVVMTSGVQLLGREQLPDILNTVRFLSSFDGNNDPHNEHDLGRIDVGGSGAVLEDRLFRSNADVSFARCGRSQPNNSNFDHHARGRVLRCLSQSCPTNRATSTDSAEYTRSLAPYLWLSLEPMPDSAVRAGSKVAWSKKLKLDSNFVLSTMRKTNFCFNQNSIK